MTIKTVSSYSCSVFCAIVVILSVSTSYWVEYKRYYKDNEETVNFGLFETCNPCQKGEPDCKPCKDLPVRETKGRMEAFSTARMVLVGTYIIALMLTLIGFIFVTVYCVTGKYYFPIGRVAICFVASAICVAAGLIVFTMVFKKVKDTWFSWSYGAGWSAAGMYIITTILLYADK